MFIIFGPTSTNTYIQDFVVKPHGFSQWPLPSTFIVFRNIDVENCTIVFKSSKYYIPGILAVSSLS